MNSGWESWLPGGTPAGKPKGIPRDLETVEEKVGEPPVGKPKGIPRDLAAGGTPARNWLSGWELAVRCNSHKIG